MWVPIRQSEMPPCRLNQRGLKYKNFLGGGGRACLQTPLDGALTALCGHKSQPYLLPEYVKIPLHNVSYLAITLVTVATVERENSALKFLPSPTIQNPEIHLRDIIAPSLSKSWIHHCNKLNVSSKII